MELACDFPENHMLSSRVLLDFLNEVERRELEVNSLVLLQDGKATTRFWRAPYRDECPQLLYSLSKSFTSIAVGIAWDEGLIRLDDTVISYFPDRSPPFVSDNLAAMTIHHLLSMNAGHEDNIYNAVAAERDWVRAFLAQEVQHKPGSYYRYSTHCTYMLSAIVEKAAGQGLVAFLMPRLFIPLNIPKPDWETCPMGITAGGMGLSLSTSSVAKFGQMLLDKGIYRGRRIVSEQYIELATNFQSDNSGWSDRVDSSQGYGYQFHLCRGGCYRGDGSFGQLCFVAPKQRLVIAVTASFKSMNRLQELLDLIYAFIIDSIEASGTSLLNRSHYSELQYRLAQMAYPLQELPNHRGQQMNLHKRSYRITRGASHDNYLQDSKRPPIRVQFEQNKDEFVMLLHFLEGKERRLKFDFNKTLHIKDMFIKDLAWHEQQVVTHARWEGTDSLMLTLLYIETPYVVTYRVVIAEESILIQHKMNVSLTMEDYEVAG
ncbi:serine hydrolase domain-containing protein, partial [Paenibacillus sp. MCAF20]